MQTFDREKTIFLVDGNAYVHRAYHALPPLTTSSNLPINAVFGFTRMILKLLKNYNPKYLCVCFDSSKPTFRHQMFPKYKSTRKKIDDDLKIQFPLVYEMVSDARIKNVIVDGFEADDIISVLANKFVKDDYKIIIISGDKDILQIVNKNIYVYNEQKDLWYDEKKVIEKYGISAQLLTDYFALLGDKIDNIPGVSGVGEKTALKLIKEYGNLENIYKNIDNIEPKLRQKLLFEKDNAFKSKSLITLLNNIDNFPSYELKDLELNINLEKLKIFLHKYEMKSISAELDKLFKPKILEYNKINNQLGLELIEKNNFYDNYENKSNLENKNEFNNHLILNNEKNVSFLKNIIENTNNETIFTLISKISDVKKEILGALGLVVPKTQEEKKIFFYIPLLKNTTSENTVVEPLSMPDFFEFIKFLFSLERFDFKVISYNFKYQFVLLNNLGLIKKLDSKNLFDIQIATYLINPTKNDYSLQTIVGETIGFDTAILDFCLPQDFDITIFPIEKFLFRAKNSLEIIFSIYQKLSLKLSENNLSDLFNKIEIPLIKTVAKMELIGIKVDQKYLLDLKDEITKTVYKIKDSIFKIVGEEFNLNSPKQLSDILFNKLKLSPVKKKKTGYSTDEEVLYTLRNSHPIIPLLLEHRELEKLKNTYIEPFLKFIDKDTKRVHTTFNLTGTATGRLSSENPNLQNIPVRTPWGKKIRKMFVAEQGYKLVSFDYSQVELRILAHFSEDRNLISAFENKEDIHTKTAMNIFNKKKEDITSQQRRAAKVINFGIIYGMSAQGLAKELEIDISTAQEYINNYFNQYNSVKEWIEKTIDASAKNYSSRTIFNRYRPLNELASSNFNLKSFGQRLAVNTPIQGTAADIIKLAMIKVDEYIEKFSLETVRMLLQIHDELVFEIKNEVVETVVPEIKNIMETVVNLKVPLVVDVYISQHWEKE